MNKGLKNNEKIIEHFFQSTQRYVQDCLLDGDDLMQALCIIVHKAWEIPKKYKGNSNQMGFISEYLIFETIKQYVCKKKRVSFLAIERTRTSKGLIESNYFVDSLVNPCFLICQGLRIRKNESVKLDLPNTRYAHDIVYLVKEDGWFVKAIFEVKSFYDRPGLEKDISRLIFAENNYPLADNSALVFVGFKSREDITSKEKELMKVFTKGKNHFCILPGEKDPELGNSKLEEILAYVI